jgi:hypothetical protein
MPLQLHDCCRRGRDNGRGSPAGNHDGFNNSNMVSEPGGLEFEPQPRILLRVIILTYINSYGEPHVAQTSDPSGRALTGTQ